MKPSRHRYSQARRHPNTSYPRWNNNPSRTQRWTMTSHYHRTRIPMTKNLQLIRTSTKHLRYGLRKNKRMRNYSHSRKKLKFNMTTSTFSNRNQKQRRTSIFLQKLCMNHLTDRQRMKMSKPNVRTHYRSHTFPRKQRRNHMKYNIHTNISKQNKLRNMRFSLMNIAHNTNMSNQHNKYRNPNTRRSNNLPIRQRYTRSLSRKNRGSHGTKKNIPHSKKRMTNSYKHHPMRQNTQRIPNLHQCK